MQCGQEACFPVDESPVAVERQYLEAAEVNHRSYYFRASATTEMKSPAFRKIAPRGALRFARVSLPLHIEWRRKLESHIGLSRKNDFLVPGQGCSTGTSARTSRCTDCGAFSASGESADNASESCTTSGQNRRAFSLTFFSEALCARLHRNSGAFDIDRIEADLQQSTTGKVAKRLCVNNGTAHICTLRNGNCTSHHDLFSDRAGKVVTRLADFRPHGRTQTDRDGGTCGNNKRLLLLCPMLGVLLMLARFFGG